MAQDKEEEIRAFVERVNQASVSFFSSGSEADARERCRALLAWAFDLPAMGKDALGRALGQNNGAGAYGISASL